MQPGAETTPTRSRGNPVRLTTVADLRQGRLWERNIMGKIQKVLEVDTPCPGPEVQKQRRPRLPTGFPCLRML